MKHLITPALLMILITLLITGCVTTNVKGYTDREYNGYKIKKAVVRAPNAGFAFGELLEGSLVEELNNAGVPAKSFLEMFPPTREWSNEQVAKELMEKGYDAILHVNLTGSDANEQTIGYINHGTASVYGNSASFSGSSTAMTMVSRYTATHIKLYDVATGRVIWVGDANTKAGG